MEVNRIICGDCLEVLKTFPDESINCCISSPPFWALRDYGVDGQLGLEPTFEEYIDKLCTIYDEVKRVLRKDGTCWVNLGDTYGSSGYSTHTSRNIKLKKPPASWTNREHGKMATKGIPAKSLCLIPDRFRIAMVDRGWIIRNKIVWAKPNPMPSSAKDRFTVDFEDVIFMTKSPRYFFEPIYEPFLTESNADRPRMGQGNQTKYKQKRAEYMGGAGTSFQGHSGNQKADGTPIGNPLGRNKRTVWTIPTQPMPEAHFATFPEKLVEPMILAGCPREVCKKCGKGRRKVYETESYITRPTIGRETQKHKQKPEYSTGLARTGGHVADNHYFKGYTDCGCKGRKEYRPGIVLDMFRRSRDHAQGSCAIAA